MDGRLYLFCALFGRVNFQCVGLAGGDGESDGFGVSGKVDVVGA